MGWGFLLAGVVTAFATVASTLFTNKNNRELTEETWERDDNAVSRRKDDLVNAGLSPTLAAGSSAGNSQPIKLENPFQAKDGANLLGALSSGAQNKMQEEQLQLTRDDMAVNWAVKDAQTLLLDQQRKNAIQDNKLKSLSAFENSLMNSAMIKKINAEVSNMQANTKLAQQRYNLDLRNFNYNTYDKYWYWNKDLPSNYSFGYLGQGIYDVYGAGKDFVGKFGNSLGFDTSNPRDMFVNDFYNFN